MYIVSFKLNKNKIFTAIAGLCLAVAVIFVSSPQGAEDVLKSDVSTVGKSTQDHIDFLASFGYNVVHKPVQIQEIIIPSNFSDDYTLYNDMQKISGFDLSNYKNKRVKKYTYKVTDYDSSDEVVANVMVYSDKIIGGDVSSTTFGGFVHGFVKE